jgi:predicted transcriptional regulator
MFGEFMDSHIALTNALHKVRNKKPEAQIAEETGIAPSQLRKYRCGAERPHLDEWPRLIRSIHEADPASAHALAQSAIPPELFTTIPTVSTHQRLSVEVLEAGIASGELQQAFLTAVKDGNINAQELDSIEIAYQRVQEESAQGLAAIETLRQQ